MTEYREEPCKSALNRVSGMPFSWSLNPYMGCAHRCTFCYVRAFERRADRPSDDRYGRSIRVKVNVVDVLRAELENARPRVGKAGDGVLGNPCDVVILVLSGLFQQFQGSFNGGKPAVVCNLFKRNAFQGAVEGYVTHHYAVGAAAACQVFFHLFNNLSTGITVFEPLQKR
jgi:hypothetical protein